MKLENTHVFVTGASGGIGLALSRLFLEEGCRVTAHYNTSARELPSLSEEYPDRLYMVQADVRSESDVVRCVAEAVDRFGPIEHMVVNHGIWLEEPVEIADMSLEQWNLTLSVDLTGSFLFAREYARQLRGAEVQSPSLTFIGSTAGIFGEADHADYASSKSALMYGLTKSLKNELVRIHPLARCNSVAPGWVRTPMAEGALADRSVVDRVVATMALRKIATPEDVARAVLYLSSPLAGHVSGQVLEVTGGMEGRLLHPPNDRV